MAMLIIDGTPLPNPSEGNYRVTLSDLDSENTGRNARGKLLRDRVRGSVYAIEAGWTVKKADYQKIVQALSPAEFSVNFFDPNSAERKTCQMYASDRAGGLVSYIDEARPQDSVWELTCTLVEY